MFQNMDQSWKETLADYDTASLSQAPTRPSQLAESLVDRPPLHEEMELNYCSTRWL